MTRRPRQHREPAPFTLPDCTVPDRPEPDEPEEDEEDDSLAFGERREGEE